MTGSVAVEVEGLTKHYESAGVTALREVSFRVAEGEVLGLLGRNGAGKSTAVRILTTLLRPTSGWARVAGFDIVARADRVRGAIGAALQDAALDELMTGREHLVLGARLAGLGRRAAGERADELLGAFGLRTAGDRIAAQYSGGMRRRLDVAMAMVRRPRVLFLDEPTTGLDPQGRRALWAIVRDLAKEGATVVLTTQYLAEADELSDRVAVLHDGRIVALGTPHLLKEQFGGPTTVSVRLGTGLPGSTAGNGTEPSVPDDGWLVLRPPGGEADVASLISGFTAAGQTVERVRVQSPTLEDVFVNLTGTEIEAESPSAAGASALIVRRGVGMPTGRR